MRAIAFIGILALLVAAAGRPVDGGSAMGYVAYDRDNDRVASVGDEVRWFVYADATTDVTFICWTSADKTTRTQSSTTRFGTPLDGYGTPSGVTLVAAGYCESTGVTTSGSVLRSHWLMVAP